MTNLETSLEYDVTLEHSSIMYTSQYLPHEVPTVMEDNSNIKMLYVGCRAYGHQFRGKVPTFGATTVHEEGDMIVCHANNRTVSMFDAGTYDSGDRWPIMALVHPQPRCLYMQIMEDGTVVALEEREVDGEHQKGVAIYDMANISKKNPMELKRWKVVENTCAGLTSHGDTVVTSCINNGVLFVKLFSETCSDYIPVSSVSSSSIHEASIAGLCCSPGGGVYLLDTGRALVYHVDMKTKDCSSFGGGYLQCAVDITFFGIFVVVLNKNSIVLFSPAGKFLRRFFYQFSSTPKAVCIADSTIIVTGEEAELFKFHIEMD